MSERSVLEDFPFGTGVARGGERLLVEYSIAHEVK